MPLIVRPPTFPRPTPYLIKLISLFTLGLAVLACAAACRSLETPTPTSGGMPPVVAPAAPLASDEAGSEAAIRFLEDRVKRDPDDFIAFNKLAGYYLLRIRETGSLNYLDLASRAAKFSLAAMPAEQNFSGLAALAQSEYAAHDFAGARDHALQLIQLDPTKSYPYQILADALLELGDYDGAAGVFGQKNKFGQGTSAETRLARFALLRGDTNAATRHLADALELEQNASPPSRETVAWCRWQLGEVAFATGDYQQA
ncbi:MAG: tetratricopeptide repeat protein, partial [Pyrinomonadaceae bacterium]